MRAKNLQEWLREHRAGEGERESSTTTAEQDPEGQEFWSKYGGENRKKEREKIKWEWVAELVHMTFRGGVLAEEANWQAVVLIMKGGGDYCGIGLMEVVWKAVAVIPNCRFTSSIT